MKQNITTILKHIFHFCLFAFAVFVFTSCNTTEPGRHLGITLNFEDASSTEVWLKLSTSGLDLPAEVSVYRNNKLIKAIYLTSKDTVLYEDNLAPGKTYTFKATAKLGDIELESKIITATTMDTTSHNFTWETFTFGGVNGSSILRDVAIINENDIWAVGEIHTAETDKFDSNGVWVQPYNAVHWNGQKWELKRIMFYIDQDQPSSGKTSSPCQTCFVFSDGKLAISSNVQTAIFNTKEDYLIIKMGFAWKDRFTINSMWGTSSKDFYVVGNNGNIAHYNGSSWEKIESGTDLDLQDIWGDYNNGEKKWEVLCVGSNFFLNVDGVIIKINTPTNIATKISTDSIKSGGLNSVWFKNGRKYYVTGGAGNFEKHNLSEAYWHKSIQSILRYSILKIRGNGLNDIIGVGGGGEVLHYNGKTTKSYYGRTKLNYGNYYSVGIQNNLVIIVGEDSPKAVIVMGRR